MFRNRVVDVTAHIAVDHQEPGLPRAGALDTFAAGDMLNALTVAVGASWFGFRSLLRLLTACLR